MKGTVNEKIRKYDDDMGAISAPPLSQKGSGLWTITPMSATITLNTKPKISAWRKTWRARIKSLAPIKWETCTANPIAVALNTEPTSHIVLSIKPIDAEAAEPKCPTIAASMKNIITIEIWANIDGILSSTIRLNFSRVVISFPLRIWTNSFSVFLAFSMGKI